MGRQPVHLGVLGALVLGALVLGGSAAAGTSAGATTVSCGPAGATTLARSPLARIYVQRHSVYGCVSGASRQVRLGGDGACPGSEHLGPLAVAGEVVAYASRTCGVDTASTQVIVRRLSDGRGLSSDSATELPSGPESFQSVGSIVVRASGAVAWIGASSSIATHRSVTEVLERSGRAVRRLDHGPAIRSGSLSLHGSKLSWEHGGARRAATLG